MNNCEFNHSINRFYHLLRTFGTIDYPGKVSGKSRAESGWGFFDCRWACGF